MHLDAAGALTQVHVRHAVVFAGVAARHDDVGNVRAGQAEDPGLVAQVGQRDVDRVLLCRRCSRGGGLCRGRRRRHSGLRVLRLPGGRFLGADGGAREAISPVARAIAAQR